MKPCETLPDLLTPELDLVFVGINPGEYSARSGHYYAHPGNNFWTALSASPLVPSTVRHEDDHTLLTTQGIGFTDVVKRITSDSTDISNTELLAAEPTFRQRIEYATPRAVCFTSSRAFDVLFPNRRSTGTWGCQFNSFNGASIWVMPSTSGRAARYRKHVSSVLTELSAYLDSEKIRVID